MSQVIQDYNKILNGTSSLGLEVNPGKYELFQVNSYSEECLNAHEESNTLTPGVKLLAKNNLTLLGAPIFPEAIESIMKPKLEKLILMAKRLKEIDAHDALFLLRNCLRNMPQLTYNLRISPCILKSVILKKYVSIIKEALQDMLNIRFHEKACDQSTRPIRLKGLGIKLPSKKALPEYLSSVCSSKSVVKKLIPELIRED